MDDANVPQPALHAPESVNKAELGGNGMLAFHLETDLKDIPASQKTELTDSGARNNGAAITVLRGRDLDPLKKFVEQELQPGSIYVLLAVRQAADGDQNAPTNALTLTNQLSLTVQLNVPKA